MRLKLVPIEPVFNGKFTGIMGVFEGFFGFQITVVVPFRPGIPTIDGSHT